LQSPGHVAACIFYGLDVILFTIWRGRASHEDRFAAQDASFCRSSGRMRQFLSVFAGLTR
jgi:hypothetical protein